MNQKYSLGIDAGGTFTDVVLLDTLNGKVAWKAKAPTTPADPSIGIRNALFHVDTSLLGQVSMVSLATTFATNAIVEDRGAEAGIILVGYDVLPPMIPPSTSVLRLAGGHTVTGNAKNPLDLPSLERRFDDFAQGLDSIAIASFFSVRNPDHEEKVAQFIQSRSNLPIVTGHRLSMQLDALKRATTAWWNARLIPLINRLIFSCKKVLVEKNISAPLMVVRGDGTLMSAETALEKPIETCLSGPAASILGAKHLAGLENALIVDMGGTTTDMAVLSDGKVAVDPEGASIGEWKTHVRAVKVRTIGVGGDSFISINRDWKIAVGPRKVVPLCTLAEQYPEVIDTLGLISKLFQFEKSDLSCGNPCCFYVKSPVAEDLPDKFSNIKYEGPINEFLFIKKSDNVLALRELKELERKGLLIKCGLTPTDIRIASGLLEFGSRDAAIIGLKVFSHYFGSTEAELAESVEEEIRKRLCMETIAFVGGKDAPAVNKIADRWFPQDFGHTSSKIGLGVTVSLSVPVIGTGAPAGLCLPATFNRLRTHCITPESYEVAVAIGAVVGMVDFTVKGIIRKSDSGRFTLHTDAGKEDIVTKDEAVIQGKQILESIAKAKMSRDHVSTPLFKFTQNEKKFKTGYGEEVFLELELRLRATGRPDINTWILESEIKEMEKQSGSVVA